MTAKLLHIPGEEYRDLPDWNWSTIKKAERSVATMKAERGVKSKPSPDMQFGSDVHSAILEPGDMHSKVTPARPGLRRGTNEWKDLEKEAKAKGKRVIKHEDYTSIVDILSKIRQHPEAWSLLFESEGIAEGSILWDDPGSGLSLKARIDRLLPSTAEGVPHLIDLKTDRDGSMESFSKRLVQYPFMYLHQLAFYRKAVLALTGEKAKCSFVVVEKSAAHPIRVFHMLDSDLDLADAHIDTLLHAVREYELFGVSPSEQHQSVILEAPSWWRIKQGATS